jgi:hypothetical protein
MMARLPVWAIVVLVAPVLSCNGERPEIADQQARAVPRLGLEWDFQADSAEAQQVAALVRELERSPNHPDPGSVGVLYRFGKADGHARYLLLAFMPKPNPQDVHRPVAFIALGEGIGRNGVSEPWVWGQDLLYTFGVMETSDFDGDGWLDVAYCTWPETAEGGGEALVVGYRHGWYEIKEFTRAVPSCDDPS